MSDNSYTHVNQFAAQQNLLVERLQLCLATLQGDLRADVARALEAEGKLLTLQGERASSTPSSQIVGSWPLLTLLVAQTIAPEIDLVSASSVAVAIECFICALDLLDDVEDDDQTPIVQSLGIARTLK